MTGQPLIRPSVNEIRHLLARAFIAPASDPGYLLRMSARRRLHQTRAKISHYRSRGDPVPPDLRM